MKLLIFLSIGYSMLIPKNSFSQGKFYVNDNIRTGDVFTTSTGSNNNNGSKELPFATISFAVSAAQSRDTILVDAGTYTEQVSIFKSVIIKGAGSSLTKLNGPATSLLLLPDFAEKGIIQSVSGIGDVFIENLAIDGTLSDEAHAILIQGGGAVAFCEMKNVNNGIFFRIASAVKMAVTKNNLIEADYIGTNFQGSGLTAILTNNTIYMKNSGFSAGVFAGIDFGPLSQLIITGNKIGNYATYGINGNSNNSTISQNSITGIGGVAINGSLTNAACNWYGVSNADGVAAKISGTAIYSPWLIDGTDTSTAAGFQPLANYCTGQRPKVNAAALDFDGINDYAEGTNTDLPQGNAARTIEAWINCSATQTGTIFNWGSTAIDNSRSGLLYNGGKLYYVGQSNDLSGGIAIPINTWTHVATTFDGTTLKLFVNGVADATAQKTFATTGTSFRLGVGTAPVSNEFFKGKLDEVRIWNRALTQCDIENNMNCELNKNYQGLVGYYKFNQGYSGISNANINSVYDANNDAKKALLINMALSGNNSNWVAPGAVISNINCREENVFIYPQSYGSTNCPDSTISLVARPFKGIGNLSYQWMKNGVAIAGANTAKYISKNLQNNDKVGCVMTATTNCGIKTYNSNIETIRVSSPVYTFTGNGNWNNFGNWSNFAVPPAVLPPCSEIVINPYRGGECILNGYQYIDSGSRITVSPGAKFRIIDKLSTSDTSYSFPLQDSAGIVASLGIPTVEDLDKISFFEDADTASIKSFRTINNNQVLDVLPSTFVLDTPPAGNMDWNGEKYGSCIGWTIGYGLLGYYNHINEKDDDYALEHRRTSPTFIWNQVNNGQKENSVTLWKAMDFYSGNGVCKWVDMNGNISYLEKPTLDAIDNALDYGVSSLRYKLMSFIDIARIKSLISKGNPVPIGCWVGDRFMLYVKNNKGEVFTSSGYSTASDGRKVFVNPYEWWRIRDANASKHAMLICGYDDAINAFKVLNSWNPLIWGDKGYVWIDYEAFKKMVIKFDDNEPGIPEKYKGKPYIMAVWKDKKSDVIVTLSKDCITPTSGAKVNCSVSSVSKATIYEKGVCYSSYIHPTTSNGFLGNFTIDKGSGIGNFSVTIYDLQPDVKYFIRAYAKTVEGIIYGNEDSFIISKPPSGEPYSITRTSGDSQSQYSLRWLKDSLEVLVKDIYNQPVANAKVQWLKFYNSVGQLLYDYTYTDSNGKARNILKMGLGGGSYGIAARVKKFNCNELETDFSAFYVEGVTVAGVNVPGGTGVSDGLNNLNSPQAVYLDSNNNIYISDYGNNRIQKWAPRSISGVTVAGKGSNPNGDVFGPWGLHITAASTAIYAHTYPNGSGDMIRSWTAGATKSDSILGPSVSQGDWFYFVSGARGIFVDLAGSLFIAEENAHRVVKWLPGAQSPILVAGARQTPGSDKITIPGSSAEALNRPFGVFVDGSGNVYIADAGNHRVQKWAPGASIGITVAGGNGPGSAENQLNFPDAVFVTTNGNVYVADRLNHRVQKWLPESKTGETVAGVGYSGNEPSRLGTPTSIFIKGAFIYIAEGENGRVTKWPMD